MLEQEADVRKVKLENSPLVVVEDLEGSGRRSSSASSITLKRKDRHPVRKEFLQTGETQYKCLHCQWTTVLNATRMVKHIVDQCQMVPVSVREHITAIQTATMEKERNSSFVIENKKDIHGFFSVNENKRVCMFCQWTTVRNLTRMRNHIVLHCTKIPLNLKHLFIKKEHCVEEAATEPEVEAEDSAEKAQPDGGKSYRLYALENDRWEVAAVEPVDYDCEDVEEPQIDDNYLEVQELDERNCNYCGMSLTYHSYEVETENEVFCSDQCMKRQEKKKLLADQRASVEKSKCATLGKRPAQETAEPETPSKQIKFVVVSNSSSPQSSTRVGQPIHERRSSTMVEICNYTIEQDDSSSAPEEAPPTPRTPLRIVRKPLAKTVPSPKQTPPMVQINCPTPPPVMQSTSSAKPTAANDEGSCHSFAGGHVYPQEDVRSADHKLQWTKAVISRPAPQFEATAVVDGAFKKIKLSDYLGKYLVFFFYPLDFTFVCPTEILAFSDRAKEFRKLNAEVIAASIDSHFTHLAWINTPRKEGGLGKINIPLVSDITHSIAKDYGVYLDDLGHTLRGLFIIDDRGILRQITMNDLPVGRSVDETLRLVQAFQYTDKHGEVCPAGWKPGQDTIVPNPEEKMKYFEKNHKY